jgi:hypothetical protein
MRHASSWLIFLAVISQGVFPHWLQACTCAPPPPPRESLAQSDAVFAGTVKDLRVRRGVVTVTFEVSRAFKGVRDRRVTLTTAESSAACGFFFEKHKSYLVYAFDANPGRAVELHTTLCTRTRLLSEARYDLDELGGGKR